MLLNLTAEIFEEFLRDIKAEHTGSFIAKKKKLNQKTVSNYLNNLEKEGILKSKTQGKNKLYSLNLDDYETIKNFILAIEHLRTIKFYKNNALIKEIIEKIQPEIKGQAILFGSYAKNTQKQNSDLDILIIGKADEDKIEKISKIYKVEINLKIYPKLQKDILTIEVIKNHIIVKNAEQFIEGMING